MHNSSEFLDLKMGQFKIPEEWSVKLGGFLGEGLQRMRNVWFWKRILKAIQKGQQMYSTTSDKLFKREPQGDDLHDFQRKQRTGKPQLTKGPIARPTVSEEDGGCTLVLSQVTSTTYVGWNWMASCLLFYNYTINNDAHSNSKNRTDHQCLCQCGSGVAISSCSNKLPLYR